MTPAQEKKEVREFWLDFDSIPNLGPVANDDIHVIEYSAVQKYIDLYEANLSDLLTARKERDAAIAERDELKEKYETDMASAKDAYDHKCEYENGIPPLCTVQGNLVQQLAKENDMLRKDAQGLVEALNYYKAWELDVNCTSSVGQEALKAWEGREKC